MNEHDVERQDTTPAREREYHKCPTCDGYGWIGDLELCATQACPDCRCPTCGSDDPEDRNPETGKFSEAIPPCRDSFHASLPTQTA